MIRTWLLVLSALALFAAACPAPAYAQSTANDFTDCPRVADLPGNVVTGSVGGPDSSDRCFDFDSGLSPATSGLLRVGVTPASFCLDPDLNASGTSGAAVVSVERCDGDVAADNTCIPIGVTLSGSDPCAALSKANYRLNVTTLPTGTEDARVRAGGY